MDRSVEESTIALVNEGMTLREGDGPGPQAEQADQAKQLAVLAYIYTREVETTRHICKIFSLGCRRG